MISQVSVRLLLVCICFQMFASCSGETKFDSYKREFLKSYANAEREMAAEAAFFENDAIISDHNELNHSYWLGHNAFSDMTLEEFKHLYTGGYKPGHSHQRNFDFSLLNSTGVNASLDWTTKGAVTPVKNQESCGSCWAYSAVGAIEGAFAIAGNPLTSLSMQQLVSCDTAAHGGEAQGCNGGNMTNAMNWVKNHSLCTYDAYPYTSGGGRSGTCNTSCVGIVTDSGFADVPGEGGMLAAINKGPVSVGIDASGIMLYKGGVLDDVGCGKALNHGVLVVGYGTDLVSGKDYYKVKNSWGNVWGEAGYIRMVRGKDQCGIAEHAAYPTGVTNSTPIPPAPAPGPPMTKYTIASLATSAMPINQFVVAGDVASALNGQWICLNGGQYHLKLAIAYSGSTTCQLTVMVSIRTIAKVGDSFHVGDCL